MIALCLKSFPLPRRDEIGIEITRVQRDVLNCARLPDPQMTLIFSAKSKITNFKVNIVECFPYGLLSFDAFVTSSCLYRCSICLVPCGASSSSRFCSVVVRWRKSANWLRQPEIEKKRKDIHTVANPKNPTMSSFFRLPHFLLMMEMRTRETNLPKEEGIFFLRTPSDVFLGNVLAPFPLSCVFLPFRFSLNIINVMRGFFCVQ